MKRHADPMMALIRVVDRRAVASLPMGPQHATVLATAPSVVVKLDMGHEITDPFVNAGTTLAVGGRVLALPFQEGHDWAIV